MNKTIQRKILVCARNRCQKCYPSWTFVPEGCEFRILHPLDTSDGSQKRNRRSGKTKELVEIANHLVESGHFVYYVTFSQKAVEFAKERFLTDDRVRFMSFQQAQSHLCGMPTGVVLADDISEDHAKHLRDSIIGSKGHLFLAHYWTP